MKRLLISTLIVASSLASIAQVVQCKAITKSGQQCHRKAVKEGFCRQHYKMDSIAHLKPVMR